MLRLVVCVLLLAASLATSAKSGAAQALSQRRAVEVYRLGGPNAEEAYAFPEVPNLVASPSGVVFARFAQTGNISVFDQAGRHSRTIGRKGQGPGEFDFALAHGLLGDTLWVRNGFAPRISTFTTGGAHISTTPTLFQLGSYQFSAPLSTSGYMRNGRAYLLVDANVLGVNDRIELPVLIGDRGMQRVDTLLHMANPQDVFVPELGTFGTSPIESPPLIHFAADGTGVVVVDWSGSSPRQARVRSFDPTGTLVWTQNVTMAPGRLTPQLRDSLITAYEGRINRIAEIARRTGGSVPRDIRVAAERALALPDWLPPVRSVVKGIDGTTWLEQSDGVSGGRWTVLDENGVPTFEVRLNPAIRLQQAKRDAIWATTVDELDVPYIVHFRIEGS
jgi:hypothetical protein